MKSLNPESILNKESDGDVGVALNLLREALGDEEKRIRGEGSQAMAKGDYDTAEAVLDFAKRLLAFTKKVEGLGNEWEDLEKLRDDATPEVQEIVSKRFFGRIGKGEKFYHIRWRNTAQWARNTMVNDDGRMKKGSRQGYWEISDKGRAWLKGQESRELPVIMRKKGRS